jgi:hypothetical protein
MKALNLRKEVKMSNSDKIQNYSGNYSSVCDFIDEFGLQNKANEVFGEGWEAENDIEQIQMLVGDDFVVTVIEPTSEREKRADNYIHVISRGDI